LVEHTNAKGPKDYCDEYNPYAPEIPVKVIEEFVFDRSQVQYEPPPKRKSTKVYEPNQFYDQPPKLGNKYSIYNSSIEYFQQDAQQYEHSDFDLNQQLSVPSPPINEDEYTSFNDKQEGTSTSYMENKFKFDLNKSPSRD